MMSILRGGGLRKERHGQSGKFTWTLRVGEGCVLRACVESLWRRRDGTYIAG